MPGARYPIEMVQGVPWWRRPGKLMPATPTGCWLCCWRAAYRGHGTFVVEMSLTRICATAGLNVLVRAHKRAWPKAASCGW